MKKLIGIVLTTIIIATLAYVIVGFAKGEYISDKYIYYGNTENWKVTFTALETGESTYNLTTDIEYIGSNEEPKNISWELSNNQFGTGGNESLNNKKVIKKEPLEGISLKEVDKYNFVVEWNNDFKEKITLNLKDNN